MIVPVILNKYVVPHQAKPRTLIRRILIRRGQATLALFFNKCVSCTENVYNRVVSAAQLSFDIVNREEWL